MTTDNPAAAFTFNNIQDANVKTALETIRAAIVAAPNQQTAYIAAGVLSQLAGWLARVDA